jgi:hypothetical protein
LDEPFVEVVTIPDTTPVNEPFDENNLLIGFMKSSTLKI